MKTALNHLAFLSIVLTGCSSQDEATPQKTDTQAIIPFETASFLKPMETVSCTLEDGSDAKCHSITVGYKPESLEIGPFCPTSLDDKGGIWEWTGENAGLYRIDRSFLEMLDSLGYRFYDDDGSVHIADIAIAEPVHDHACINVSEDESVEITMLIPVTPVMAEEPTALRVVSKVGVSLDGVPIFSDAPPVQVTGHLPALDTCGGHVDPGGWYHWHATSTDIDKVFRSENVDAHCHLKQNGTAIFGYAFDGFAIHGSLEIDDAEPQNLDECNGHVGVSANGEEAYHYHAAEGFPNLPKCLSGVSAQNNFSTTATAGVGAKRVGEDGRGEPPRPGGGEGGPEGSGRPERPGGPGGTPPGFEEAANKLGVSLADLTKAMEDSGGPRADLGDVAGILGVSEDDLRAALPPKPGPNQRARPGQ